MYKYLIIGLALFTLACKTAEKSNEGTDEGYITYGESEIDTLEIKTPEVIDGEIAEFSESSEYNIMSAEIEGNTLKLQVSYIGGCGKHSFRFVGSPDLMKSLPPKRNVKLIHKASKETCKSIVVQPIDIDISALAEKQEAGSEVHLLLEGYKGEITYIFK